MKQRRIRKTSEIPLSDLTTLLKARLPLILPVILEI